MNTLEFLNETLSLAKGKGADAADVFCSQSRSTSIECRNCKVEKTGGAEQTGVSLRVFVGKRTATASTGGLDHADIHSLVDQAIAIARHAPENPFVDLAARSEFASDHTRDLQLYDDEGIASDAMRDAALEMEAAAQAVDGVDKVMGAGASFGASRFALATSEGFAGESRSTSFSRSCAAIAENGSDVARDFDFSSKTHLSDLAKPAEIGARAGARAVAKLGGGKIKTGKWPIVLSSRVSHQLLDILMQAISGPAVATGMSFLKDALGESIFAKGVSVKDDPHLVRTSGSRLFDGEGVAARQTAVIDNGVLASWLLNKESANQLGLALTGHGGRLGVGVSASNLFMCNGELTPDELMPDISYGLYVTEIMGRGANPVTGDFSHGVNGILIENGELTIPIKEATIAGNVTDMFRMITPANDLTFQFGQNAPTLRIDGMTAAG